MKIKLRAILRILFSNHFLDLSQTKKEIKEEAYKVTTYFCCRSCELDVIDSYMDVHELYNAVDEAKHIINN